VVPLAIYASICRAELRTVDNPQCITDSVQVLFCEIFSTVEELDDNQAINEFNLTLPGLQVSQKIFSLHLIV